MNTVKINIKYSFHCDPQTLFHALTRPAILQTWLAPRVDFDDKTNVYTFHRKHYIEAAKIVESKKNQFLKWDWVKGERDPNSYISFLISSGTDADDWIDLFIEDFCDKDDEKDIRLGWEKQLRRLEANVSR